MATFKAVITYIKEDGSANVKIRVTHNRVIKYMATPIVADSDDIDKSGRIINEGLQDRLNEMVKKCRQICNELGFRSKYMNLDRLIKHIQIGLSRIDGFNLDFIAYGREYVKGLQEQNRKGSADNYCYALNSLQKYTGREILDISEVTSSFLASYERWLRRNGVGDRGVGLYTAAFKKLFRNAQDEFNDEEEGLILIKHDPFKKYKIVSQPVTRKRALPVEVIRKIRDYEADKEQEAYTRDVFMLSFYLVGLNSVDLFTVCDYRNGRLYYERSKTRGRRKDMAAGSIKVEPETMLLLEKYKDKTGQRVFDFYTRHSNFKAFNHFLNDWLKGIGKSVGVEDLEYYAARHSWATIARNKCRIPKDVIDIALNHSNPDTKMTDIYIEEDHSLVDEANRKILDFLKEK